MFNTVLSISDTGGATELWFRTLVEESFLCNTLRISYFPVKLVSFLP